MEQRTKKKGWQKSDLGSPLHESSVSREQAGKSKHCTYFMGSRRSGVYWDGHP